MKLLLVVPTLFCLSSVAIAQDLGLWEGGKILPDFPNYSQPNEVTCGPTAASMVLSYYGVSAGIQPLAQKAGTYILQAGNARIGLTRPDRLTEAMNEYFPTFRMQRGNLNDIVNSINGNKPVILLVRSATDTWHYIVVYGYMHGTNTFEVSVVAEALGTYIARRLRRPATREAQ